ncbi:MAG TPA: TolC family protein [bacterium]
MKRYALTLWITLFFHGFVFPMELTLDEAIKFALENNNYIGIQQAEVETSEGTIIAGRSGFLPKLEGKLTYYIGEKGYTINSVVPANSMGPGFPPADITTGFDSSSFTYDYSLGLTLTQPLFTGGKIWNAYRQSVLGYNLQNERLRQTETEVILQVKSAFFGVILAKGFAEVSLEAKLLAQEHLRVARVRYNIGEATEYEVLRSEVEVANLESQVIKAENGARLATLALRDVTGIKTDDEIIPVGGLEAEEFKMSLAECVNAALLQRPEIIQLGYQKEMAERMLRIARGGYLPSLALVGNYQSLNDKKNGSRLFDMPEKNWQESYSLLLMLSVPVLDGFYNYGKVKEAKAGVKKASEIEAQALKGIILELKQGYASLEEAKNVMLAGGKNVQTARRAVEIAQVQYRNGLITSLELLSAEVGLTQARTNYLQAQYDYALSVAKLKKAIGEI